MVREEGRVEVEELGLMSSGPSVHTSSRVPKARRQSRTLGVTLQPVLKLLQGGQVTLNAVCRVGTRSIWWCTKPHARYELSNSY